MSLLCLAATNGTKIPNYNLAIFGINQKPVLYVALWVGQLGWHVEYCKVADRLTTVTTACSLG